jgi:hypothetical protein
MILLQFGLARLGVLAGTKSFAGMARSGETEFELPLRSRNVTSATPPCEDQNNRLRGLLYFFPEADTLRQEIS